MKQIQNYCLQPTKIFQETCDRSGTFLDKNSTAYKIQNHYMQTQKVFDEACNQVGDFLDNNSTLYKIAIFATHIFRSFAVLGMVAASPFSPLVSMALLVSTSLLYRAAVERFCRFRFTLPSLVGGTTMWVTKQAVTAVANKSAFTSIGALFSVGFGLCSFGGYLVFACCLSHLDVEKRLQNLQKPCCS